MLGGMFQGIPEERVKLGRHFKDTRYHLNVHVIHDTNQVIAHQHCIVSKGVAKCRSSDILHV